MREKKKYLWWRKKGDYLDKLNGNYCTSCGKVKRPGDIFYLVKITLTCDFDGYLEETEEEGLETKMKDELKKAEKYREEELEAEVYQEIFLYLCKSCRDQLVRKYAGASPQ